MLDNIQSELWLLGFHINKYNNNEREMMEISESGTISLLEEVSPVSTQQRVLLDFANDRQMVLNGVEE